MGRLYDADEDWRAQDDDLDVDNVATAAKGDDLDVDDVFTTAKEAKQDDEKD